MAEPLDQEHDRDLVARATVGDRAAFSSLVDRHWAALRRWLYGLTGDSHQAEDLAQEAFTRAWAGLPGLRDQNAFRTWLFRVARNLMLEQRRGPRGARPAELSERSPDLGDSPLTKVIDNEAVAALAAAICRVPEPYRATFLLWSQEGFPYSEIARIMAITEENARWRVCRARRLLVKELQPFLGSSKS